MGLPNNMHQWRSPTPEQVAALGAVAAIFMGLDKLIRDHVSNPFAQNQLRYAALQLRTTLEWAIKLREE